MDEAMTIRHRVLVQGVSRRTVAREMGVSRNTVKRYVEGAEVGIRRATVKERPGLLRAQARMDELLTQAPSFTGGKHRLTSTQLHRLIVAEGVVVGATLVKQYVREWRRQRAEVFVPLVYLAGDLGEVDFFEMLVDVAGVRRKAWMFLIRAMASGKDFAWLFPRQDQVCFLEGHVRAFEYFGGTLHRLAYDNLKPAVTKVLVGSERELSARFAALSNHSLFEASFARPRTGHDKGGVEARGKGIRLRHFVPIPTGDSLEAISRSLLARLEGEAQTTKDANGRTVAERFAEEQGLLLPLPEVAFVAEQTRYPTVSRRALVQLAGGTYSVWSRWAGLEITAKVGVDHVELIGPDGQLVHPRATFGKRSVDYRHYLPELSRKPQALRQVASELLPRLGEVYAATWRHLVDQHGPKQAARIFAQVLKATVERGETEVTRLLTLALASGESVQLAVRPMPLVAPNLVAEALPEALRNVHIDQASAADFDVLLGAAR